MIFLLENIRKQKNNSMNIFEIENKALDIFDVNSNIEFKEDDKLQRTAEWFKQREGKFTGSEIHKLMGTTRASSKLEWGRAEKIIDFSETAKKYVYSKAKERQRNKVIRLASSVAMNYGTNSESVIIDMLKNIYPDYKFKEVGFIEFIKDIAGASPDGLLNDNMALEIKASTNWDTVYNRHETPFEQKHQDFWQIQSEMLALKVNKCMYVVAEPSESIFEPNITDLSIKIVDASIIHQQAIIQRCMVGNAAIKLYLSGVFFQEAIRSACTNYDF